MSLKNADFGFNKHFTLQEGLGKDGVIYCIAWSPDGRILASGSNDNTIRLWDAETGQLLKRLRGHSATIYSVAWSPDGRILASGSNDNTIRLWDAETGQLLKTLPEHMKAVYCVAWSPNGRILASGSNDNTIRLWNAETGQLLKRIIGHTGPVLTIAWSKNENMLASGSGDATIRLWDAETGQLLKTLPGHTKAVYCVAWSPSGYMLASGSDDNTIRSWHTETERQADILEGHTAGIMCVSFSSDGSLLASKSVDGTVRLWNSETWKTTSLLNEKSSGVISGLAFHPSLPILATLVEMDVGIRIWNINLSIIPDNVFTTSSIYYTNAKVVLVGDTGVGKSGLWFVLNGNSFFPTESTHGRQVSTFDSQELELDDGKYVTCEILLWDLAGQVGYRLIHQLYLSEVAVALIVFDSRSETDPFAGVYHWARALKLAERIRGNTTPSMKKFLVAARSDRGGRSASYERIKSLMKELDIGEYVETSAKEGQNIVALAKMIRLNIDWSVLPRVTSTELFQHIKAFLITERKVKRLLSTIGELYQAFLQSRSHLNEVIGLYTQFDTCISLVESQGLIRRLNFGNLILLQPELLDAYASALVNAVKQEPEGLGNISEEKVRAGDFFIPQDERLKEKEQEKLLLIVMIEDLLRYEIALREPSNDGDYLIFPSQSTRENPDIPNPEGKAVVFSFEGPILNIYATLAVRLSHSGIFKKESLWRNAVTYTAHVGGVCGMSLYYIEEGYGELTLFYDQSVGKETKFYFEEYIRTHLQRRALPESINRQPIFMCPSCHTSFTDIQIKRRRSRGFNWIACNVCGKRISILDKESKLTITHQPVISEMDQSADTQRELSMATSILRGKAATSDFDVFLCYNGKAKLEVKKIGEDLKNHGILPWLDEWELQPGLQWQRLLEKQIAQISSVAVFVGSDGLGPWQQHEIDAFLREFVKRGCPIIPVLLADAPKKPKLPIFLRGMTWVDFRKQDPGPLSQLIWGITGKRDARR
jgi:small GTP-binding protein